MAVGGQGPNKEAQRVNKSGGREGGGPRGGGAGQGGLGRGKRGKSEAGGRGPGGPKSQGSKKRFGVVFFELPGLTCLAARAMAGQGRAREPEGGPRRTFWVFSSRGGVAS